MQETHCDGTWDPPNAPAKCTWKLGASIKDSPHNHVAANSPKPKVLPSILEYIGNTPMVRLDRLAKKYGVECNLYAKCEFFNPGGSVKDRIGYRMVIEAHKAGKLVPGCTLIEPTSGNTGIGIALASAVLGYKCIIVLPEKMSKEKVDVLKGLGAQIVRTRTSADFYEEDSHIRISQKLRSQIPNSVILDQYCNPYNPVAHYDTTAEEIINDCDGKIDALVLTAGTGGTVAGISRKIKEKTPACKVVAVDPVGSMLALPASMNGDKPSFYEVEGIGYEFLPSVFDRDCIDEWLKVDDFQALPMSREVISTEGLLCGGSSGSAVYAAIQVAKKMKKGETCVVLLPDSVRNYLTKFLSESWMIERDFLESEPPSEWAKKWWTSDCSELTLNTSVEPLKCDETLKAALDKFSVSERTSIPVVDSEKKVVGTILTSKLHAKLATPEGGNLSKFVVKESMETKFKGCFAKSTSLGKLYHIFDSTEEVVVLSCSEKMQLLGMLSKSSFLSQLYKKYPQ